MKKDANLSSCGNYRYTLSRVWAPAAPQFLYIGVNPSTADAELDDQTVRKCVGFTEGNGGGGFSVVNLFAYRTADVDLLTVPVDPVGPLNNQAIALEAARADKVIACWGSRLKLHDTMWPRIDQVLGMLDHLERPVWCFGLTKTGDPLHPLMLSYDRPIVRFQPEARP